MSIDFVSGGFLVLLALTPVVWILSRSSLAGLQGSRRWVSISLRILAITLAVCAVARMRLLKKNDRLCVIFVVDRSDSIPSEQRTQILEHLDKEKYSLNEKKQDYVGLIIFGKDAGVEASPSQAPFGPLDQIATLIDPEATDIESAIQLAAASFPADAGGKRIVLFSDGNENHGKSIAEIRAARAMGIEVDVVPISYSYPAEISVEKLLVDSEVNLGQPFGVQVVVDSTEEADVKVLLFENDTLVPQDKDVRRLKKGRNYFQFPNIRRTRPGRYSYRVQVEPLDEDEDAVVQNNVGHGFTMIHGEPKILFCTPQPELEGSLLAAWKAENIAVDVMKPEVLPRDMEEYFGYGAIVLSNVGAHAIPEELQTLFKNLVRGLGVGFVMIGGEDSFGAGGYQGTPIEELLPVEMELKQKKVLPNGALAMVVHSCEMGNGNFWARKVCQQAVRILSPKDYAGVIYYDMSGRDTWLFPMMLCSKKQQMFRSLRNFNPGDMPSFRGIMQMAYNGLKKTRASIKHMIILTDGDPSMPSQSLIDKITKDERITISTIVYGAHGNVIPQTMKDLARMGNGKFHYLRDPKKLPELFLREATTVRKSLISEEAFRVVVGAGGPIIQGFAEDEFPALDGYVLTTAKPLANVMLRHPGTAEDPTQDPVLAAWTYYLGKSVAFTSDAGRRWGKQWATWPGYQQFWGQLIRWVAKAEHSSVFRVKRQIEDGQMKVVVDLIDDNGQLINGANIKGSIVTPGADGETKQFELRPIAPGRYAMPDFPIDRRGTYGLSFTADFDGTPLTYTTGVSVPYSPEYRKATTDYELLNLLAEAGGGEVLNRDSVELNYFNRDFEASKTVDEVWSGLLLWALLLFFCDVAIRRVMIDPRGMTKKALEFASRLGRGKPASVEKDERLATLLKTKAKVKEQTTEAYASDDENSEDAPSFDGSYDASGSGTQRTAPSAGSQAAGSKDDAAAEDDGEGTYTSRLLRAKRRALKNDDQKD